LIKLRIDVDYPYPSRLRSFFYTTLGIRAGGDYLKNSKILARMINESSKEVKAYWFFTPRTMPDQQLLQLLNEERHEVALHIANKPYEEKALLEKTTGRKIEYYTVHGTARFLARLMWKRWTYKAPQIPEGYPLISFYQFPTFGLDVYCFNHSIDEAKKMATEQINEGKILHVHPIWLFQRGKINHRGPYYETLRSILDVDNDLKTLNVKKRTFFRIARDGEEYVKDCFPTDAFIDKMRERGVDVFTFIERKWSKTVSVPSKHWVNAKDNIGFIEITSYDDWLQKVGKKTRNMIRKAEKSGVIVNTVEPDDRFAEGIWKIYNETPIRQERGFPHYGETLRQVTNNLRQAQNYNYIGAYLENELVGFIQLEDSENLTIISQILSLQKYRDKAVNNALIAKAIEVCAARRIRSIMYGRIGNHPSLDVFKTNNGFYKLELTRYYVPITWRGRTATMLGLQRELKDSLPQPLKYLLMPFYNWTSRARMKIRLLTKQK
jgi:hypothetical protein